jgi:hypothetical protein
MKLSKCCKRLIGLKETTKPKDNLVKLERVDKWYKCQTVQKHQNKRQTWIAEHKDTCLGLAGGGG